METAIKWSPNSTLDHQRFLFADVSGRSFNLGRIEQYSQKSRPQLQYELAPAYRKVPTYCALDWASFDENLVAVGTPSGETSVLRIDDSGPPVSFPAKHQRLCNAVAFGGTGLLASGLERGRNDFCLNVWDVNQKLAAPSPVVAFGKNYVEPSRKFASSEAISSIKFFSNQPKVLIVGVKGFGIRIYDTRENTGSPSLQYQTFCVHNIAVDPFDENYFACAGPQKDTTIQIWDRRYGWQHTTSGLGASHGSSFDSTNDHRTRHGPVMTYQDIFNSNRHNSSARETSSQATIWSLRYCKGKGGFLGALASNGAFRVFETQQTYVPSQAHRLRSQHNLTVGNIAHGYEPTRRILTKRTYQVERALEERPGSRPEKGRIVSFDFTNLAGPKGTPCAIVLRGDQSIDIHELSGPPTSLSFSPSGELAVSKVKVRKAVYDEDSNGGKFLGCSVKFLGEVNNDVTPKSTKMLDHEARKDELSGRMSSRETHELTHAVPDFMNQKLDAEEALSCTAIARQRCSMGYRFDCDKNIEIVKADQWLQYMWEWIKRAKSNAADRSMTWGPLDLSYLGVYGLWKQDSGIQNDPRKSSNAQATFANVIARLNHRLDLPRFTTVNTTFPALRQLCLYTCGLSLKQQQLGDVTNNFVRDGQHTKAAAFAIIHNDFKLAANILKSDKASAAHRELSLAIAGYVRGDTDDIWDETIQGLALGLEEPYARAILALVRRGDWHDVLEETSLPLRDRVGIALMYLSDEELSQYINTAMVEAIRYGDTEGIVLTGLTHQSVSLFENHIRKFADLQTAILALSHVSPRYFTDPRVTVWRETYRSYMDKWRMHIRRAQFDVQVTKLSTPPKGQPTLPLTARQFTLRCAYCDQAMDRHVSIASAPELSASSFGIHQGSIFGDAKSGTVCPKCGRHMPRCVICLHWLGMPDGHGKSAVAAATNASIDNSIDMYISVCNNCHHMSHGVHAKEWFAMATICAANGCDCRCTAINM